MPAALPLVAEIRASPGLRGARPVEAAARRVLVAARRWPVEHVGAKSVGPGDALRQPLPAQ